MNVKCDHIANLLPFLWLVR